MEKITSKGRTVFTALLSNESLFLLAAFLLRGLLIIDPLAWHMTALSNLYDYLLCPWGGCLIAMRLARLKSGETRPAKEMPLLLLLFAWICVPFLWRFGATFNNMVTDIGYAMVFFGVYGSLRERPKADRQRRLFELSLIFTLTGLLWGGLLLICAFTGRQLGTETGGLPFGVREGLLYAGVHYNSTAMMAICMLFLSVALFECSRNPALRILAVLTVLCLALVIILTQSRTARYAMLLAFAAGAFVSILQGLRTSPVLRTGAAFLSAAVILAGGYLLSARIMDMALAHYARLESPAATDPVPSVSVLPMPVALAEEVPVGNTDVGSEPLSADVSAAEQQDAGKARAAVDATFSDRTNVWHNLFDLWRSDLKKMLIGRGVGNTGSLIAHDTTHEADGTAAVHNTYLQFIADFGVIGFLLQLLFFLSILPNVWRAISMRKTSGFNGLLAMAMLALALLAVGMMESAPLGQMTPTNLMLYTSLALLAAASGDAETFGHSAS